MTPTPKLTQQKTEEKKGTSVKTVAIIEQQKQPEGDQIGHKTRDPESPQFQTIKYAFYKRGLDFVLTLNAENGRRELGRQSDVVYNGVRERSFGLCQLQEIYHAPMIRNTGRVQVKPGLYRVDIGKAHAGGFTDQFLDYKKHVDYCVSVRDNAINKKRLKTTFYGYNVRHKSNNGFYLY